VGRRKHAAAPVQRREIEPPTSLVHHKALLAVDAPGIKHVHARSPAVNVERNTELDQQGVADLAHLLDDFAAQDEARIAQLFADFDCRHVYLDVGTNVGVQLRKLFEPHKYPKAATTLGVYRRFFGATAEERCGVCAIGVEPNPHHRRKLGYLQQSYRAAGAGVLIFHVAASASDGVVNLALGHADKKDPWEDLGASASEAWKGLSRDGNPKALTVPVRAIDLSRLIHLLHQHLRVHRNQHDANIVMKLDVEGLEFAVLPDLVRSQALCLVDAMRIEWHKRFWDQKVAAAVARARNLTNPREVGGRAMVAMTEAIRAQIRSLFPSRDCRAELLEADDETYMHDRKPWPEAAICNRTG